MQNRALRMARLEDEQLFSPSATRFWTPHSNRTFLPSATGKIRGDVLSGWSAQASGRHARISSQRIRNVQRTVVAELQTGLEDPLAEAETLAQFDEFLSAEGVPYQQRNRGSKLLERTSGTEVPRAPEELTTQEEDPEDQAEHPLEDVEGQYPGSQEPKRRKGNALVRTETLGSSPIEARARIREELEPGFYVCRSGKKKVKTLHQLGRCHRLPGVDYLDYSSMGKAMPRNSEYDCVCRLCAREGVRDGGNSSATVSSSSSSEGGS